MAKKKIHRAWLIMIACCFLQAGGIGALSSCAGIFFQPVCQDLGFSMGQFSIYLSIQGLFLAFTLPVVGKVLPKFNIRILISVAVALCSGTFMLMSTFTAVWQWYIAGAVVGICGAFIFVLPAPIMIGNWFKKKTGIVMGITMSFSGIGGAIISPIVANFVANSGWRPAYILVGAIAMVLVLPFSIFVMDFKPADRGLQAYGSEEAAVDANGKAAAPTAAIGVSSKDAMRSMAFVCVFLVAGFISLCTTFQQHLPGFAASVGMTAAAIGTMTSCVMIGNIVGKLVLGFLNDKLGQKHAMSIAAVIVALSFVLLIVSNGNPLIAFAGAFCFGFVMAMSAVLVPIVVRTVFGSRDYSAIFSYISMGTSLIGSAGVSLIGFMYDGFGSYVPSFFVGIAACVLVVVALLAGLKAGKKLVQH
ncbi:MAG: MFS transporter [Ruthenibacterium sp.]